MMVVIPCIDTFRYISILHTYHLNTYSNCRCVDLRTGAFDVPPQEILTRDSVTISVDAVVYYQVRS